MIRVEPAAGELRRKALRILLQELPEEEREQQIADLIDDRYAASFPLDGLLAAFDSDRLQGAVLFMLQPDGTGFVWPPRTSPVVSSAVAGRSADALLQAVSQRLDAANVWLGQCIVDPDDKGRATLSRNGYPHLTDLLYLQRPMRTQLPDFDLRETLDVSRPDPNDDEHAARFAAVIEQTYQGSLDCADLNGMRSGVEAVAGHKAIGTLLRNGWFLFCHGGVPVGVLIFADQPEQDAWELVYMGVVPEARGNGFGREMLLHGLSAAARDSGRRRVLLAVDATNHFARSLYDEAGFDVLDVKSVHVRPGKPPASGRASG